MAEAGWGPQGPIDLQRADRAPERIIAEGDEILVRVRVIHVYPGEGYVQVRFQSPLHDGAHFCPVRAEDVVAIPQT